MAVGVQNSNPNGRWYSKLMPLDLFSLACYLTTSSSRPVDWGLLSFEFPDRRRSQLPLRAAVVTRVPVGCFVAVVGSPPPEKPPILSLNLTAFLVRLLPIGAGG